MSYKNQILNDVVSFELFNTYQIINNKKVYRYELEGYDKEKIESEGSIWIVYTYDCLSDFYHKNKQYFDNMVKSILLNELQEI